MNSGHTLLAVLLFAFLMQACTADVYVPVSHSTPLLEEKGELDAAIYTSTNGTDLQAAYALTKRFGVGTDLNYLYRDFDMGRDFQKHKYGELSFIYFVDLKDSEFRGLGVFGDPVYSDPQKEFKLELLGSVGLGEGEELRGSGDGRINEGNFAKGRYTKYSLQSNAAIETDIFTIGLSPRLSYISYHDFLTNQTLDPELNSNKTSGLLWEPALFMGIEYENVKLEYQIGIARVIGNQPAFGYERFYMSIGVHVNLNVLD